MTPLADAMRLIHRDQAALRPPQKPESGPGGQPFRRHVEQLQPTLVDGVKDLFRLFIGIAGRQSPRLDPHSLQRANLIAHQGDEGRDDDGHPVPTQGRQLETQGFAATRRHDGKGVLPRQHSLDDFRLTGAEIGKAENGVQKRGGAVQGQKNTAALFISTILSA